MARSYPSLNVANNETNESYLYPTAYLFPRKPMLGTKPLTTMAPAACELGGQLLIYCKN